MAAPARTASRKSACIASSDSLRSFAKVAKVSVIAQAGEQFQRFLGFRRKTAQPADHQVHRIVAELLVDDSVQIPRPRPRARIELDQRFFCQTCEELPGEERIAAASPVHQFSERPHLVWRMPQGVAQQLVNVVDREWARTI